MSESYKEALSQTFLQVIQDVAMLFGEPADSFEIETPGGECVEVRLAFSGAGSGSLRMLASNETAAEVAANVLGLDPDDEDALEGAPDAIMELVNVTMGQLLTVIGGTEAVFDLTPPELAANIPPSAWQELLSDPSTLSVMVEDCPMLLQLTIDEGTQLQGERA